jgi:hypothetical protein
MTVRFIWKGSEFKRTLEKAAIDGLEECVRVKMATQAKLDCPVDTGTLRGSIGVTRLDEKSVMLFAGGAASKYAFRQEVDRSLHHTVGKAGFIRDSVYMYSSEIPTFIKKRAGGVV